MELAKSKNELACAQADLRKIQNRIAFMITAVHNLKERSEDLKI